tara:strand:+ start:1178 stop:2461 length:1284 start_codon:yes stop_codon:yes gene_type:complete
MVEEMNLQQRKADQSYWLFQQWWESVDLTNYEKSLFNKDIITFNQQLLRLKENKLRIGVFGKAGVGKSSILNNIFKERFFNTSILNGSTLFSQSKELSLENSFIKTIEFIDSPGFDNCNLKYQGEELINNLNLDLILFITTGDLNRKEVEHLSLLINKGKNIIIIFNKIDIWSSEEIKIIKSKIIEKLPINHDIPIITYSIISNNLCNKNKIYSYLKKTIDRIGYGLLINNTYQIANILSLKIKEKRLIKGKKKAQFLIGKFATLKASSVALNPILFVDIAGSTALDTLLISELGKIYGLQLKSKSAIKLLKSLSLNNLFLGITQIGIFSSFNLIKKISLILVPFTSGISLLPYSTVAILQAALAVQTTKLIGKLVAKEILQESEINTLEPFKVIQQIALKEPEIIGSNKFFLYNQCINKDYSIFIP